MENSTLPTPRHLLTSIFNSLTTTPIPPTANEEDPPSNILKSLPPSHRGLLATLHVLIPPPTLLQALDLLDRRLVTRITPLLQGARDSNHDQPTSTGSRGKDPGEAEVVGDSPIPPDGDHEVGKRMTGQEEQISPPSRIRYPPQTIYRIQSSQAPKSRFSTNIAATGIRAYTVHLDAWNCDCAAFAFAAYPATGGHDSSFDPGEASAERPLNELESSGVESRQAEWEFGGLSLDGMTATDEQGVPCCKHLLACVLAERWETVLGRFVNHNEVSLEEFAGMAVGD